MLPAHPRARYGAIGIFQLVGNWLLVIMPIGQSMRSYCMRFTNGQIGRHIVLAAPDLIFAGMKARRLAQNIMHQKPFGVFDWTKWHIVIEAAGEGRFDEVFPTPVAD